MNYYLLLFRYTTNKLIKSWSFWLLLLFLLCSFMSAIYQTKVQTEDYLYLYASLNLLANVSFGYIAGYIFYLVSDFSPNIKAEFCALHMISYAEYEIMSSSFVLDFHRLCKKEGEEIEIDYKSEYELFKFLFCEKPPYEKVNNDTLRLMAELKIHDSFVSDSKNHLRHINSYFDMLLGKLSQFLPYDEIVSLTKLKSFYSLDFAHYDSGKLCIRQFQLDSIFQEYYYNRKNIAAHLKERTIYCIDSELRKEIMQLETYPELNNSNET